MNVDLTPRERRVLGFLSHGLTVPEISEKTGWTQKTVKNVADLARYKFGAKNRTHAVALALSVGAINPLDPYGEREQLLPP